MVCRRKTEGESSQLAHVSVATHAALAALALEVSESPWGIIYDSESAGWESGRWEKAKRSWPA